MINNSSALITAFLEEVSKLFTNAVYRKIRLLSIEARGLIRLFCELFEKYLLKKLTGIKRCL